MQTDPPRVYFQVELKNACLVRVGKGDDAEIQTAAAGEVVNLSESFQLKVYRDDAAQVRAGGAVEVWMKVGKKQRRDGGKSLWLCEPRRKMVKAPTGPVVPLAFKSSGGDGEEAPF